MHEEAITLQLTYRTPFDWESLLSYFRTHQIPNLEAVDDMSYERIFKQPQVSGTGRQLGSFRVSCAGSRKHALQLTVSHDAASAVPAIVSSVRRMFDLDANPATIAEAMAADPCLSQVWQRHPGLRVARAWDRFESLINTILGQLVSVSFGRTLIRELMQAAGTRARHPKTGETIFLFPSPQQLLSHDLLTVRTSPMRRVAIRSIASLVKSKAVPLEGMLPPSDLRKCLRAVPGIGAWSAEYIAMRGFSEDDAFPATDYALKQEIKRHPGININHVRPLRAYAAVALWKSFAETKGVPDASVI